MIMSIMGKDIEELRIGKIDGCDSEVRKTAQEMDIIRQGTIVYEYLCRLEEAKTWMEACLKETLPQITELEENLRNGVYLAKLGNFIAPELLPLNKIYDIDQRRYKLMGLQFKHTDNINKFLQVLKKTELPVTFQPETTDIYDKKNMPRVIYCIHALSSHLFKLGKAPVIHDVFGKAMFTDEELESVSKDLQKYEHPFPMFQKIGGILSKNSTDDSESLNKSIIELNRLLDTEKSITSSLLNPELKLKFVQNKLIDEYKKVLKSARYDKIGSAHNHSLNDSYVPDEYDEVLTLVEIQGHITATNYKFLWKALCSASNNNDINSLHKLFNEDWVNVDSYNDQNLDFYCDVIKEIIESNKDVDVENVSNWHKIFQNIINSGNQKSLENKEHKMAILYVNKALDEGDPDDLYLALNNPHLELNIKIDKYAIPLLFEEMKLEKFELEKNLNESQIAASVSYLTAIATVSEAVERGDETAVWNSLNSKHINLEELRSHCRRRYFSALVNALQVKIKEQCACPLLTLEDIHDTIEMVNIKDDDNEELVSIVDSINKTVSEDDAETLMKLLKSACLKIHTLNKEDGHVYLRMLKKQLLKKDSQNLWYDDIVNTINDVNIESFKMKQLTDALVQLNLAILKNRINEFWIALSCPVLSDLILIDDKCKDIYFQTFSKALKKRGHHICPWIVCHTETGNTVYIDVESYTYSWTTPKDYVPYPRYLTKKDVLAIIEKANKHHTNKYKQIIMDNTIVIVQAYCRGYLLRDRLKRRQKYFKNNVEYIIKIQAWWRKIMSQRKYSTIIKMKTIETKLKQERKQNPWVWYKVQEQKIIKIQALWRGRQARQAFKLLFYSVHPPLKVVKKFIPILDFATEDYDREIELQTLKSEVVHFIRKNQELSKQLDDMDLKIGLLIQNRIALQEVAAHGLKLNNLVKHNSMTKLVFQNRSDGKGTMMTISTAVKGLKSLTKESKRLLDGYQHLFYELQTNPTYLSKLLFCIPQNKTNFFLQNVVLSLYNFGAYTRDEYLLLKLFRFTLEEEVSCKVMKPFDIITSTPLVLKMAVSLSRQLSGLNSLQSIIGPLVEKTINDKNLNIETGPIEIYKAWRNETEMKTGEISKLPYNVTQEEALSYPEVKLRLERALSQLKTIVTIFLDKIVNSVELLPFCITYMSRVLHRALCTKFPNTPEKDILKVIGNLVYYQFLNAAIVAPDAFHIINLPNGAGLTTDQRKNLASVAKILHFAAAKKGFGEESSHLRCLNPFIVECHEKMKELFRRCCRGPTLEEYFEVDEYSEATLLHHPHIYITVKEIVDTHALLIEYQDIIAPDPRDRLNELLDDLGDVPTVAQLASRDLESHSGEYNEENSRLEVCLALVNKFQPLADDMTNLNKLFIKTKELCVAIIPFLSGEHLLEALCIGTTKEQQSLYAEAVQRRIYSGQAKPDEVMTLREHIAKLRRNLEMLEDQGYVTREDGYQAIVTSIALDLCNKGKYRRAQKRALATLTRTKESLIEKTKYYEEKCKSYDQYIKSCLDNLHAGKRSVHACLRRPGKDIQKLKSKLTAKYSGAKLMERGVLLEIDGLSPSQFKNVQFDIIPTDINGVFTIKGKFLGIEMDSIEIDIQNLLQKQYEGCAVIDLFGKAKINVNLLIFLLNSKFYGKS